MEQRESPAVGHLAEFFFFFPPPSQYVFTIMQVRPSEVPRYKKRSRREQSREGILLLFGFPSTNIEKYTHFVVRKFLFLLLLLFPVCKNKSRHRSLGPSVQIPHGMASLSLSVILLNSKAGQRKLLERRGLLLHLQRFARGRGGNECSRKSQHKHLALRLIVLS